MNAHWQQIPASIEAQNLLVEGQGGFRLDIPTFAIRQPGTIVIIGSNGSGKSTFLDAVLGLLQPKAGNVRLLGRDLAQASPDDPVRRSIGAQLQGTTWTWSITVREIAAIHRQLYGAVNPMVLKQLGVVELARLQYRKLSTGQRRRVDLAVALAHDPDLIVLDEPASGLDRRFEENYRAILAERSAAGATILMASHDARDLAGADRVLWLDKGRIVEDDTPAALTARLLGDYVCVLEQPDDEVAAIVAPLARFNGRDGDGLLFAGDAAMRQAFLGAMAHRPALGYATRPARAADLLQLLRADERKGDS